MKDFFDDFSGIVHIPGGAVEYENGVLVERKEKPLNKKPTCRVIARQKIPSGRAIDRKEKKMKKRFTFVYEFLRGGWSFLCVYADTLKEAEEMFYRQMTEVERE